MAHGQETSSKSFNDWLNERLVAKVNRRSSTKQTEAPSQSIASTTMVDQSSATDLISLALSPVGLFGNSSDTNPRSVSVTASAYSAYALLKGQDPMSAQFYNDHAAWRRLSFTVGSDNGTAAGTQNATITGMKVLIVNRRDLSTQNVQGVFGAMQAAAAAFGHISTEVAIYLIRNPRVVDVIVEPEWKSFLNKEMESDRAREKNATEAVNQKSADQLFQGDPRQWTRQEKEYFAYFQNTHCLSTFGDLIKLIGNAGERDLDDIVNRRLDAFPSLDQTIQQKIQQIRKAPQFSVALTSTTRPGNGANEYVLESIFDYGVADRVNLTLNNTFNYKDAKALGGISRGSQFALDLQFQLTPEKRLTGRGPVIFCTGMRSGWMTSVKPTHEGQIKINIPIADGIDLPVSVTFANQSTLMNGRNVIGKFGFTFDTAKLSSLFSK